MANKNIHQQEFPDQVLTDLGFDVEEIDPEFAKNLEIEDGTKFTEMKEEIARDQRIIKELKDC